MITAFGFGLAVALLTGLAGELAWRRLPGALSGFAALLGTAVAMTAVAVGAHLHLQVAGWGVPALVFGLITGGQAAHLLIAHRTRTTAR